MSDLVPSLAMPISLKQNPFELLRIDGDDDSDDDSDDDVASAKEPTPTAPEPVQPIRKPKRKFNKKRKRIISPMPDKESTAASKNHDEEEGQTASLDDSPAPPDAGREDDPGAHTNNIVLTTSFRSSSSYVLSWQSSFSHIPSSTNNLGKRKRCSTRYLSSPAHGNSDSCCWESGR